jgi:arginyl-tRNA synthetase
MNNIFQIKKILKEALSQAAKSIEPSLVDVENQIAIEIPRDVNHGDFASNLPLLLSKQLKESPTAIAAKIKSHLTLPLLPDTQITPMGGFINFKISNELLAESLFVALKLNQNYGKTDLLNGEKVLLEFVSANPTGPLNVVNARAAALGDCLSNLLEAAGAIITKEYYINDAGVQSKLFAESIRSAIRRSQGIKADAPEGGYQGNYIDDLANEIIQSEGIKEFDIQELSKIGIDIMVKWHKQSLEKYGVYFNSWFSEYEELHRTGKIDQVILLLKQLNYTYQLDEACWFEAKKFGAEKDEVLIKKDTNPSYFAADIAYHVDKFNRGYTKLIDIWGPDHHGHINRLKLALLALKLPVENFNVLIAQQVNLLNLGLKIKMSKREGNFITMDELLNEVGKDAARFSFIMRGSNSHLDFDIELVKKQTMENPVYYLQYAHARICSLLKKVNDKDLPRKFENFLIPQTIEVEERNLLKAILEFPYWIYDAAIFYEPHRLVNFLHKVSAEYHSFYSKYRILDASSESMKFRIILSSGIEIILKNGLHLLGISAPEQM